MPKRSSPLSYDPSNLTRSEVEQVIYNIQHAKNYNSPYHRAIADSDPLRAADALALMHDLLATRA